MNQPEVSVSYSLISVLLVRSTWAGALPRMTTHTSCHAGVPLIFDQHERDFAPDSDYDRGSDFDDYDTDETPVCADGVNASGGIVTYFSTEIYYATSFSKRHYDDPKA